MAYHDLLEINDLSKVTENYTKIVNLHDKLFQKVDSPLSVKGYQNLRDEFHKNRLCVVVKQEKDDEVIYSRLTQEQELPALNVLADFIESEDYEDDAIAVEIPFETAIKQINGLSKNFSNLAKEILLDEKATFTLAWIDYARAPSKKLVNA